MIEFIASPIYHNWMQHNIPEESLIICTPFLRISALRRLLNYYSSCGKTIGSYNMKVLLRAKRFDFVRGSSDIRAFNLLGEIQEQYPGVVEIRIVNNLHMKAYCVDNSKLLITSGNLTPRGAIKTGQQGNVEGGISTDEDKVIAGFKQYFEDVFSTGINISEFLNSQEYSSINEDSSSTNSQETETNDNGNCYNIPEPEELLEYPERENEETDYFRFEIRNTLLFTEDEERLKEFIPQNALPQNYYKAIQFISENEGDARSIDRLAYYLGTKGKDESTRERKPRGVITNLRLLGLVKEHNASVGVLPDLTVLGERFLNADEKEREEILCSQSKTFPWMEHIIQLREDNPDASLSKIILEYLCNKPFRYAKESAKRYRPAMVYFCRLNGIK